MALVETTNKREWPAGKPFEAGKQARVAAVAPQNKPAAPGDGRRQPLPWLRPFPLHPPASRVWPWMADGDGRVHQASCTMDAFAIDVPLATAAPGIGSPMDDGYV